ncbi:hypothetical protein GCM10022270_10800 [Terriglobus aquaticus]
MTLPAVSKLARSNTVPDTWASLAIGGYTGAVVSLTLWIPQGTSAAQMRHATSVAARTANRTSMRVLYDETEPSTQNKAVKPPTTSFGS